MGEKQIGTNDKLRCAQRELALRLNVYPKLVAQGKMRQANAKHEADCMAAIVEDYKERLKQEQGK